MEIIRSKRRTLVLQVKPCGRVIVRAPQRMSRLVINQFIEEKQSWIEKVRHRLQEKYAEIAPKKFVEGELFWYLGKRYSLSIISHLKEPLIFADRFELSENHVMQAEIVFLKWYRAQAADLFQERVRHFAEKFQFRYGTIRLSSAKQRWGSCSATNNLNFSWKLIMAPLNVIDYVVVHELVHTKHKNHSQQFWLAVAAVLPSYRSAKQWLKQHGHLLEW